MKIKRKEKIQKKINQYTSVDANYVVRVDKNGTVFYSNKLCLRLFQECGIVVGEKLSTTIGDLVQRVLSKNSPEKMEIKAGKRVYLIVFYPLPEQECVNISGFNISDQKKIEDKLQELFEDLEAKSRELIKVKEALQKSESKYWEIIETAQEGVWVIDKNNLTLFVNKKVSEMLGYGIEEILRQSPQKFLSPEFCSVVEDRLQEHRQRTKQAYDYRFIKKDGSDLWCIVSTHPLFYDTGEYAGSLGMLTDITERKKAEEALKQANDNLETLIRDRTRELENAYASLKEKEERLAEAQKLANVGSFDWDIATNKEYWSDELYRIFRLESQFELNHDIYLNFVHPDDLECFNHSIKEALNKKQFSIDYRIILPDGKERVIHSQGGAIYDENNRPIRMRGIVQDITERKKAEEKIQILARIVESSNDAIGTVTSDGTISSWNKGGELVYGYSTEEIIGKNISILAPPNLSEETKMLSELVKQGEMICNHETKRLRKDGKIVDVSLTLSPLFDNHGRLTDISYISRDISDRKIAEEKLFHEKQIAEAENRTKSEFLANMSHELRTPLNSIIGFSDMLREQVYGELNEKQLRVTGNISTSGKHLLNLINNLLDISKVEAGKMELNYKSFDLTTKLNMLRNLLYPIADCRNIKIEIDIDSTLTNIYADEDKFAQIIYNLVDNAIKFSFENSIVIIEVRKKGEMLEISVKDTGIGIKDEDQKKLFKPFSQIDYFSSKKYQGTGLGLSLVKQIVLLHGGHVWFKSKQGEGSTFAFTIPIRNNRVILG